MNGKENDGAKSAPKNSSGPVGIDETAQFEVFRNGNIPKERLREYIVNDVKAIMSFCHAVINDPDVLGSLTDGFYKRYEALHRKEVTPDGKS